MKMLITGAEGQVGSALCHYATQQALTVIPVSHQQLDITDATAVNSFVAAHSPELIINTAAYTAVDDAEQNETLTYAVNHLGAQNIAKVCHTFNLPLIHLSTDYVFDGNKTDPYLESDTCNPLQVYGVSKLKGEQAVAAHCQKHIILRTSGIFSTHGHNFVRTILNLAQQKDTLPIVDDQFFCPTSANDLARVIVTITPLLNEMQNARGIYHYCSLPKTSWFRFAKSIFNCASTYHSTNETHLEAVTSAQYPTAALRPHYSVLDCQKLKKTFGIEQHDWHDYLPDTVKNIMEQP